MRGNYRSGAALGEIAVVAAAVLGVAFDAQFPVGLLFHDLGDFGEHLVGLGRSRCQRHRSVFLEPFLAAGIETMKEILEWHALLKNAIERDYPMSDDWFGNFRRQIQASLKHTEAMASTDYGSEGASAAGE